MIIPNIWENIKCSKPPTRLDMEIFPFRHKATPSDHLFFVGFPLIKTIQRAIKGYPHDPGFQKDVSRDRPR